MTLINANATDKHEYKLRHSIGVLWNCLKQYEVLEFGTKQLQYWLCDLSKAITTGSAFYDTAGIAKAKRDFHRFTDFCQQALHKRCFWKEGTFSCTCLVYTYRLNMRKTEYI